MYWFYEVPMRTLEAIWNFAPSLIRIQYKNAFLHRIFESLVVLNYCITELVRDEDITRTPMGRDDSSGAQNNSPISLDLNWQWVSQIEVTNFMKIADRENCENTKEK